VEYIRNEIGGRAPKLTDGTKLTKNDQCATVVVDPPPGLRYIVATKDRTSQMKLVEIHRNCLYYPGAGG